MSMTSPADVPIPGPTRCPPLWAVDVGATKLEVGLVSRGGEVLGRARARTPRDGTPDDFLATLLQLFDEVNGHRADTGEQQPQAVGIGSGGPMGPPGDLISPLNIPCLRDYPLRGLLADATGLPVYLDNDAKALALAEGWVGAAVGESDFLAMVVSSGVGAGIVLDGRLLHGVDGNAGHLGHVNVEPGGRRCGCESFGCLEAETSGLSIQAITGAPPSEASDDVITRTGTLVGRAVASAANLLGLGIDPLRDGVPAGSRAR